MQYNHDDRQRRTDLEIIEAEDGAEILADGGTDDDTEKPVASVEAFVEPTQVDIEVTVAEGSVKIGTPSSSANLAIFFTPDQVETLAVELEEAAEKARLFASSATEDETKTEI